MRISSLLTAAAGGALLFTGTAVAQNSDECAGATPVMGLGTFTMDTTAATTSGSSPCAGLGRDVWFAWTATSTDNIEFSTCGGAGWDTALAVYGGTCSSLNLLSCNDDACGLQSRVVIAATAGQTYFVRAGAFNGGSGGVGTFSAALGGTGSGGCPNPTTGADVIVGDIPASTTYGLVNGMGAYSLATTSCNVGDQDLLWFANTTEHPVIGQNIYRLDNGRFEQIGLGWLKHGFFALQQNLCCDCDAFPNGERLGVGCSDPYSSGLNGSQPGLGPRSEVDAHTGLFTYPFTTQGQSGDRVYKRIQVLGDDVDPNIYPDAQYFGEAQYVSPDDAAAGNGFNNVSYCDLNRPGSQVLGMYRLRPVSGSTVRERCAVRGWEAADSSVVAEDIMVPGEGMFVAGSSARDNGDGTWTYNYAIFNNNSDFSGQSFTVPFGSNVTVTGVGMSFPLYHSGEPYSNLSWSSVVSASDVTWSSETFAQDSNGNALRWGTTYSFWFTADAAPQTVAASLGLFKPGNPGPQAVSLVGPGDSAGSGAIITNYCTANVNSTGLEGSIVASNVDLTARTMDLTATGLPANEFGFFITSQSQGFEANPGGSAGNLCVTGDVGRGVGASALSSGSAGSFSVVVNLDAVPTPTSTTSVMIGETHYFQGWHRDGAQTSNFTDGVSVLFQ